MSALNYPKNMPWYQAYSNAIILKPERKSTLKYLMNSSQ